MGESTTRYFRDKPAMRMRGEDAGLPVPPWVHLLNDDRVWEFTEPSRHPGCSSRAPWPGQWASAKSIRAKNSPPSTRNRGDQRSFHLPEKYVPGDVFHVDSIVYEGEILFAVASRYGRPPLDVPHGGGVFSTHLVERGSPIEKALLETNARALPGFGLVRGVSHTGYIRSHSGEIYFLETSA
jgi:hypothetical protein